MTNLGDCLIRETDSVTERYAEFDPYKLAFTRKEKEQVKDCLEAQKKAKKCAHCRWNCGSAMKKGIACFVGDTFLILVAGIVFK